MLPRLPCRSCHDPNFKPTDSDGQQIGFHRCGLATRHGLPIKIASSARRGGAKIVSIQN
jgi:hypothetical protein